MSEGWDTIGTTEDKTIASPVSGEVGQSNDDLLAIYADIDAMQRRIEDTKAEIRRELWRRSGGDEGPKTRTIAGSKLKAKLEAGDVRWDGRALKVIAGKYPKAEGIITPQTSYRVAAREWAQALKTTSDDPVFREMVAAIQAARQPDGLPSLKVVTE